MNEQVFDQKYKSLNAAQKKAVDTIDGPVMVIAGPGTGKTTILTLRIANILKKTDTPPHGILAITYTDAGVKAMRAKLEEVIGSRAHEIAIHTFHSFASAMMSEYPDHFTSLDGFKNLTDVEQESLIRSIISEPGFKELRPIGNPDYYISQIMRGIEDSKRDALSPEMVKEYAEREIERIENDPDSISRHGKSKGELKAEAEERIEKCKKTILFSRIYWLYEEEKLKNKRMDFNDLIIQVLKAMESDELFLRLIQERFLYILVDEHQDTNDAQNLMIKAVAQFFDVPNIFIVGDEKQAIYRFQGASVENFLSLQKRWPGMRIISLDKNYRSHKKILDASFAMIEHNYEGDEHHELRVELKPGSAEKERPIDIVSAENTTAMDKYLVEKLKSLSENEPSASVAIIARRNREVERIIRLLEANGVTVSSERSVDIFHHPVGSLFFDLLLFLDDWTRTDSLARTIVGGLWNINIERVVPLIKELKSGQAKNLETSIPALALLRQDLLDDGALGFLVRTAELSGFVSLVAKDPSYVHVWSGIISLAESLAREGKIQNPTELVRSMLAYRQSAESKTVKVSVGAPDVQIRALTAHGSKGLEFDYVFMPHVTEEAWVGRTRGSSFILPQKRVDDHDIRDTRRLFYVAITRAKKHAVILTSLEEGDGKSLTPLRFISELDQSCVSPISLPRIKSELPRSDLEHNKAVRPRSELVDIAKKVLLDSGLSVTALNHFLQCPNEFLYLSILKLPQAPSPAGEKGNAMHLAMSHVWQEENKTIEIIEARIKEFVGEYLVDSFLASREKEAIRRELFEVAPAVAKALLPHFNQAGVVSTERWFKASFQDSFEGKKIVIPIHGKLDAVLDDGQSVLVFDYKTKQAMSVNAIKGLTKDATGDYFRQLVFYKMLLSKDIHFGSRKVTPALVFISPDEKGRCPTISLPIDDGDIKTVEGQIKEVIRSVWSGDIANSFCDEQNCEWCGLKKISIS